MKIEKRIVDCGLGIRVARYYVGEVCFTSRRDAKAYLLGNGFPSIAHARSYYLNQGFTTKDIHAENCVEMCNCDSNRTIIITMDNGIVSIDEIR